MNKAFDIRLATTDDASSIANIYNHYVENTVATFDLAPISTESMAAKIETILKHYPYYVAELNGKISGYAYAGVWKPRKAYQFTCETSIYLDHELHSRGLGTALYQTLITKLREMGMRRLVAGISLPNDQSVKFHEKLGFIYVGTFKKMGLKFDRWVDVGYWEQHLD